MKIVHYHNKMMLKAGGVVRAVLDLSTALADAGHEVTLLTCFTDDLPPAWLDHTPGFPKAIRIDRPTLPGSLFTSRAMRANSAFRSDSFNFASLVRCASSV